ncbi:hypothetical protein FA15DRAFT_406881 [Coprinopsis marcescibilis]|uniref:Uncharacterized protein n=1 Tax=Coprinopsis marcescibilis TaxID=230819 RepID=A0A5C3KW03_COPMA|nr:hypothetical protein FA15DRAFT_406881 [Coprinopsis marcescibilis]
MCLGTHRWSRIAIAASFGRRIVKETAGGLTVYGAWKLQPSWCWNAVRRISGNAVDLLNYYSMQKMDGRCRVRNLEKMSVARVRWPGKGNKNGTTNVCCEQSCCRHLVDAVVHGRTLRASMVPKAQHKLIIPLHPNIGRKMGRRMKQLMSHIAWMPASCPVRAQWASLIAGSCYEMVQHSGLSHLAMRRNGTMRTWTTTTPV